MRREVLQKDKSGGARSALQCPGYKDVAFKEMLALVEFFFFSEFPNILLKK